MWGAVMTPHDVAICERAAFDHIRYAQVWEDGDVLVDAMGVGPGDLAVSIASAGDNALALVATGARVVAVDLSPAQLACLRVRVLAYKHLSYEEFLGLMGARASHQRGALLERLVARLPADDRAFWVGMRDDVIAHGLAGIGKFERYFRLFRTWVLPLVHGRSRVDSVLTPKSADARATFFDGAWNSWRWRAMLGLFFSKPVMGRLGRDKAFFDHVSGSLAQQVAGLTRQALVEQDPSENPYLHWILTGCHGAALPRAWRRDVFAQIRARLVEDEDAIVLRQGGIERLAEEGVRADGFNLSDIFEYMGPQVHHQSYEAILAIANPGARLVYWNMMAPRRVPDGLASRVRRDAACEARMRPGDKAFFYSDFVVEEVV